jgi:predicted transcriptional regulator
MEIDDLIEEKTQSFTGDGGYYFTYVTPEDCKKIVEQALKQANQHCKQ